MQSKFKWLFVPPAIALVMFLGPLQSGAKGESQDLGNRSAPAAARSVTTPEPSTSPTRAGSALPKMPGMWQIASTLIGVLLLGGVGIAVLKRAQQGRFGGAAGETNDTVRLRQSLRLSQKNTVHAVEFDGALLLVGECDGKLGVLHSGTSSADRDEHTIALRDADASEDDDDGVVLRDMVIPRPAARQTAPEAGQAARSIPAKNPTAAATAAKLANFKNLLAKAGSGR